MAWIDISVPIRDGMVHWPNNAPVRVEQVTAIARGGRSNTSRLSLGVHTGTHVDAPVHFLPGGAGVDAIPLDALVGVARVIEIHDPVQVTIDELQAAGVCAGERILLKTRNSPAAWQAAAFVEDAVHLAPEAAAWLAATRVKTIGIDYLSVGGFAAKNGRAVHHALMHGGVWIIEGLDSVGGPGRPVRPGVPAAQPGRLRRRPGARDRPAARDSGDPVPPRFALAPRAKGLQTANPLAAPRGRGASLRGGPTSCRTSRRRSCTSPRSWRRRRRSPRRRSPCPRAWRTSRSASRSGRPSR